MIRFLKRSWPEHGCCDGCALATTVHPGLCYYQNHPTQRRVGIFTLVPRPPDGTRCLDLDGNIKVVGGMHE